MKLLIQFSQQYPYKHKNSYFIDSDERGKDMIHSVVEGVFLY